MTDEQQQLVIVVDDNIPEETREMLQSEMNKNGLGHILVIGMAMAGLSPHMTNVLSDVIRLRVDPPAFSWPFGIASVVRDDVYPKHSYHDAYTAQLRKSQIDLAGHYVQAAKWRDGVQHAAHRGRENRHAERIRNARALMKV